MAHTAAISNTVGDLVTSLTGKRQQDAGWIRIRDGIVKTLRDHTHVRVNQFAVMQSLDGLVEKFSVRNRDDLAEALEARLQELPTTSPWLPELLSLLMALSDRPLDNTDPSSLDALIVPSNTQAELTWDEILAADPVSEDEIWEDIEHGDHSSGDDSFADDDPSEPTVSTHATSAGSENTKDMAKSLLSQVERRALADTIAARKAWEPVEQDHEGKTFLELAVIRETCMMLHGLPTDLYVLGELAESVTLAKSAKFAGVSLQSTSNLLTSLARDGTSLNFLRLWARRPQKYAFVQSAQARVRALLMQLDEQLSEFEMRYLPSSPNIVVSILEVRDHVGELLRPYVRLSSVIQSSLERSNADSTFPMLDALFDSTCIAQASGDEETFILLSSVFLAGLSTYTRLITAWVNSGSLDTRDKSVFFVQDARVDCDLGNMWHERFKMRYFAGGTPYAPQCLRSLAAEIFALGKSKCLLVLLDPARDLSSVDSLSALSVSKGSSNVVSQSMVPFSQLLNQKLRSWLTASIAVCGPIVQSSLLQNHNLLRAFDAIRDVFFAKNGSAFLSFAQGLIENLISSPRADLRGDAFLLTSLASETFGTSRDVDADSVSAGMSSSDAAIATSVVRALGELNLSYNFTWPIQNITQCRSSETHTKAFALLLQMYYAKKNLDTAFLRIRRAPASPSPILKLSQRLYSFVEIIQSHVITTADAVHDEMIVKMRKADSVDAMVGAWASYEKALQINLLLATKMQPLQSAIVNLLELSEAVSRASTSASVDELLSQYESHLSFLLVGTRSIGRPASGGWLESFAERLQWHLR